MKWTKFYNFNEVLDIKPFAHKDGRAAGWKCKFNGLEAKFATRDGCQLKQNNHLDNDDCGIYWLRANEICEEDIRFCENIGLNGLKIIEKIYEEKKHDTVNILTHCNAGWLATINWGTATSPIYHAHKKGIPIHVWVDETRPRNQGANLT